MIIWCQNCGSILRSTGGPSDAYLVGVDSDFWPDKYRCPLCEYPAKACLDSAAPQELLASPEAINLSTDELYAALMGCGIPSETRASTDNVKAVMEGKKIKTVVAIDLPGYPRCVVNKIILEDGAVIYLSSGCFGATVYRMRTGDDPTKVHT